jgi:hypothetical protein
LADLLELRLIFENRDDLFLVSSNVNWLPVFDIDVGFASHAEVRRINAWLKGESDSVDDLASVVGLIVIDVDARAMRRDINRDVMSGSMDKILSKSCVFYVIS